MLCCVKAAFRPVGGFGTAEVRELMSNMNSAWHTELGF